MMTGGRALLSAPVVLVLGLGLLGSSAPAQTGTAPRVGAKETRKQADPAPKRGPAAPLGALSGDPSAPVTVDADHLESLQKDGVVIFTGNVVARQSNSVQYAERMEVYLDAGGNQITRTVSTGGVRIVTKDCQMGTARRAEYYDAEQQVILIGNARVWQEDNVVTGERITIFLAEDRSVVEGGKQERVKAIFHPRREQTQKGGAGRAAAAAPCQ